MTNAELLELLREARERADSVDGLGDDLERRIDAALAERQDSATDVVESDVEWDRVNAHFFVAYPDDETSLTVSRIDLTRQEWRWDMEREMKRKGYCATEAEAQQAALDAAKEMR